MTSFSLLAFVLLHTLSSTTSDVLAGEWSQTDLRSMEVIPAAGCTRVWLEERTYLLQAQRDGSLSGAYRNVIRAVPVSAPSFSPNCKFPPPADSPIAFQLRMWNVSLTPTGDKTWLVRARPGPGGGDFNLFKTEEFTTTLRLESDGFVDSAADTTVDRAPRRFRRPAKPSAEARRALEETIERIHGGGCLEVFAKLLPKPESAAQICAMRRQLAELQGRYQAYSVDIETAVDRVYEGFPLLAVQPGFRAQPGILVELKLSYQNAKVPGDAFLVQENGRWRVAVVWF